MVVHTTAAADPEGVLAERLASEMANYAWQARKTGQLQPFVAALPRECMGQLASFGPT